MPLGLLAAVLLASSASAAAPQPVGCTPLRPLHVDQEAFAAQTRPLLSGPGARVVQLSRRPGAAWDIGEGRTARLSVYLTKACALGLSTGIGHESSSLDLDGALADFARTVSRQAPGWALSVEAPSTIVLTGPGARHQTDLRALLQARLDAATPVRLGEEEVGILHDGASLFVSRPDLQRSLLLSRENYLLPAWAVYDLRPYGLPRLAALFEQDERTREQSVTFWAMPEDPALPFD